MEERLQKILASHGIASRRAAEKMIEEGRVSVNGAAAVLGQKADAKSDDIRIDGKPLRCSDPLTYIMLNKPAGYVTTMKDEKGRKTVLDLVSDLHIRVYPVGRLDMDSKGLIIMTNDGDLANALMHPAFEKNKKYIVTVSGDLEKIPHLRKPMVIDGYKIKPAEVRILKKYEKNVELEIIIHEGRNRQIRKMCALCSLDVKSLKRISIGSLEIGELPEGTWRHLTKDEIDLLK